MIASDMFTCEMCGGTFDEGCDDEARDELERNFGERDVIDIDEECAKLCDGCYEKVMAQFN